LTISKYRSLSPSTLFFSTALSRAPLFWAPSKAIDQTTTDYTFEMDEEKNVKAIDAIYKVK
jgi:hypothetical protein